MMKKYKLQSNKMQIDQMSINAMIIIIKKIMVGTNNTIINKISDKEETITIDIKKTIDNRIEIDQDLEVSQKLKMSLHYL